MNTSEDGIGSPQKCFPKYWTLSHRWGDPTKVLQLYRGDKKDTPSNESHFRGGISLDELSPTFRHAVQLVYRLGYRYIWIDSLCIFQDSPSDWEHEAPLMRDVYGNSFCNISAIRSSHEPSLGLFGPRTEVPHVFYPFLVDATVAVPRKLQHDQWRFWSEGLLIHEISNSPLNRRAWVVQERFLSRRIIHITRIQMYWECLGFSRSEANLNDQFRFIWNYGKTLNYKTALRRIVEESAKPPEERSQRSEDVAISRGYWRLLVEAYSGCDLTCEEDRLIAIFGVAKRFEEFYTNDRYLAGLWKNALHTDLTWECHTVGGAPVKRDVSVAPSWSWASLRGGHITVPVAPPRQRFAGEPDSLIEFVDARIRPEGSNQHSTEQHPNSELDIKGLVSFFNAAESSENAHFFADHAMSQISFSGKVSKHFDTEEAVQKHAQPGHIVAFIPTSMTYGSYEGLGLDGLIVEHVSGCTYRRLGKLSGIGMEWFVEDKHKCRILITLV